VLRELLELRDLALALSARGVLGRERVDQAPDAVPDLEREVRSRRACERADLVDRHAVALGQALGNLGLAHQGWFLPDPASGSGSGPDGWPIPLLLPPGADAEISASSASSSTSAWTRPPTAELSPISQTWL
jgi:hypothetical protein